MRAMGALLVAALAFGAAAGESAMDAQKAEDAILEEARRDIEANRKSDAVVRVVDANGKPVAGAAVSVEQTGQRHSASSGRGSSRKLALRMRSSPVRV